MKIRSPHPSARSTFLAFFNELLRLDIPRTQATVFHQRGFMVAMRFFSTAVTGLVLLPLSLSIHAATNTWTGADPSGYWSAPANWSPAGVPVNGNDLVFSGGSPPGDVVRYAGDGQFRITRARGRIEADGTVISEILPRRL